MSFLLKQNDGAFAISQRFPCNSERFRHGLCLFGLLSVPRSVWFSHYLAVPNLPLRDRELVEAGFNPKKFDDPIYYSDLVTGEYRKITQKLFDDISNGVIRL